LIVVSGMRDLPVYQSAVEFMRSNHSTAIAAELAWRYQRLLLAL
jgi:hypothetical protein